MLLATIRTEQVYQHVVLALTRQQEHALGFKSVYDTGSVKVPQDYTTQHEKTVQPGQAQITGTC